MRLSVICHDIRSIHNVGSIFRTSDAADVEKIYLCGITPGPEDRFHKVRPDFAKVSLGAENSVAFESMATTEEAVQRLKSDGWTILMLEQSERSIPYDEIPGSADVDRKFCMVLGNEVEGLPDSILSLADHVIEIPMRGAMLRDSGHPRNAGQGKESLNVSVSFGIAMFGLLRTGTLG